MDQTRRDIEPETRRAIQEIRNEVADLTVLATEKVTRKSLTDDDQQQARRGGAVRARLRRAVRRSERRLAPWRRSPPVYARSLFEVAEEHDKLDVVREQLGEFADALDDDRDLQVFFFSPYFSTQEKKDGLEKAVSGAEPIVRTSSSC